jgi:hypothetical protein
MYSKIVEFFGIELFCGINLLFCIILGKNLIENASASSSLSFGYGIVLGVGLVFSFVSTVLMAMTTAKLHQKMTENNRRDMPIQPSRRTELDHAKAAFVATTVLIWIVAIYTYFPISRINQFIVMIINLAENSTETQRIRAVSPLILFLVGGLLMHVFLSADCKSDATVETFMKLAQSSYAFFVIYVSGILIPILLILLKQGSILRNEFISKAGSTFFHISYLLMVILAVAAMWNISDITGDGPCFKKTSALSLYAVYFTVILFGMVFPLIPPKVMTTIVPIIMENIPALGLLATSAYLVYITNKFTGISAEEVIA